VAPTKTCHEQRQARLLLTPASDQSSGHRSPARMNSTAQTKALMVAVAHTYNLFIWLIAVMIP